MSALREPGRGVQVVDVNDDGKHYQVDIEALEQILLQDDVRDCYVVLVSVAGAYRGGKSFLLDFFLRYLRATPICRSNGDWIGEENEPLNGFNWRVGSERHTTGMLLWSQPIHVTLESGEKVVVLLMDTQGTFDSYSTIRECTTIFALSTLLSSVQIYNLSMNIREDDLQHLQFFTEYGRLAQDESWKPFQELKFLVRDWPYPDEHAYGAGGGQKLLTKRLEILKNQPEEIRKLREHIYTCFETLSCFLMPHPGFKVSKTNFNGCISDIGEEFRMFLLELVPSIFKPSNLTLKVINGQKIKAKDLFDYFKSYLAIFNSDELPTPVSILKATSDAGLLMAMRESRELYEAQMERECGLKMPSVSTATLSKLHRAAMIAAQAAFINKKKMGSQNEMENYLKDLTKELEEKLAGYITLNDAKVREVIGKAKETFELTLSNVHGTQQLCLHPEDLELVYEEAVQAAMDLFDKKRRMLEGEIDDERITLLKHFKERLTHLRSTNKQNNEAILMLTRESYVSGMERIFDSCMCVSRQALVRKHESELATALSTFRSKRNRQTDYEVDEYKSRLIESIKVHYEKLKFSNRNRNKSLIQMVLYSYNNYMASVCCANSRCLHPDELSEEHEAATTRALDEFNSNRVTDENEGVLDEFQEKLVEDLGKRYIELQNINKCNNEWTVQEAYSEYCRIMDGKCGATLLSLLVVPLILKIMVMLPEYHKKAKEGAKRLFWSRRRSERDFGHDKYLEDLEALFSKGCINYCNPVIAVARELGLPLPPHIQAMLDAEYKP